ncbi:ATP-binding cassette domain-containing protein [candidate division GN15 bacterium]|nr:ATP-binding cassette domain-containing protein [candidate division GN15 bacterium]
MTTQESPNKPRGRFSTISGFFREYKAYLIWGGLFIVITNSLALINPYIINSIFTVLEDKGVDSRSLQGYLDWWDATTAMDKVLYLVVLMITLAVLAGIFRFLVRRTIIWTSRHIEYRLRGRLVSHLMTLSQSYYHNTRTGDIMARATNDLEAVRMMVGPGVMHIANTIVGLVIALGFMLTLSPKLTLYALTPMLIFPYLVNKLGNLIHKKFTQIQAKFSDMNVAAQENLSGMRVVKAYGQEEAEIDNFSTVSSDYVDLNLGMAKLQGVFYPLIHFLAGGINLIILYVGGRLVISEEIPLGTVVAFFAYSQMMFWPLFAMGWVVSLYQRGTASLDRINRILFTEPAVKDEEDENLHTGVMHGKIEFRNLKFDYDGIEVLKDINLTINPGQTIGIMGLTGSGKTTLASLIARLYPVNRGQVFLDEIDINDWQLESLRRQIGFATQEPFLFSDTMADNIRFGDETADLEQVRQAAAASDLAKDIESFPKAYETMVGERGITLSGGQKQRTAIARALVTDPAVLILDDATSSVDTETEHEIHQRVHRAEADRTTLIISHRVSSVKDADLIVFLDDGRIVEQGTHEALLDEDGHYAALYRSQLLEMEIEAL